MAPFRPFTRCPWEGSYRQKLAPAVAPITLNPHGCRKKHLLPQPGLFHFPGWRPTSHHDQHARRSYRPVRRGRREHGGRLTRSHRSAPPNQWGAETPGVAFDCSGLTQAASQAAGTTLLRTAQAQYDDSPRAPGRPAAPTRRPRLLRNQHNQNHPRRPPRQPDRDGRRAPHRRRRARRALQLDRLPRRHPPSRMSSALHATHTSARQPSPRHGHSECQHQPTTRR